MKYLEQALEYLEFCDKLLSSEYPLSQEEKKILKDTLSTKSIIQERIKKQDLTQDKVHLAAVNLYMEVEKIRSLSDRYECYFKRVLNKEPKELYKYLCDKSWINKPMKYVTLSFIDYNGPNDDYGHTRNPGELERFYGNGNSQTLQDFYEELDRIYGNCPWTEVRNICGPYIKPQTISYQYCDLIITVEDKTAVATTEESKPEKDETPSHRLTFREKIAKMLTKGGK